MVQTIDMEESELRVCVRQFSYSQLTLILVIGVLLISPLALPSKFVYAESKVVDPSATPTPELETADDLNLDYSHGSMQSEIFSFIDEVDSFFDDARTREQRKEDYLRVGAELRFRDASAIRFRQKFRLGINLSALSDRLEFIAEGDGGDNDNRNPAIDRDTQGDNFFQKTSNDSTIAGLRYTLLEGHEINADIGGGLRFSGGPDPYGRLRFSRFFELDEQLSFEPAQFFLWERNDGFGEKNRFDLNYLLHPDSLLRSRTEAFWGESSEGVDFYQEFSYFKQLNHESYLGWLATLNSHTRPSYVSDEYRLALRYRSKLYFPWLIGEVEPALAFPNDHDYHATSEIIFRIDVYFDRRSQSARPERPEPVEIDPESKAGRSLGIDLPD